ncbi:reprolysin-like metallopeptidase [Taibaiella koreensis]|uniref:reprolysin-like metallopeptidase n=1 Tax=Taibaiella koreensis TaxID=1268548 RepID=UPI0013C365D0|nr:zinc-dependent metalloprotease family protein [Taibaiella koreensis]
MIKFNRNIIAGCLSLLVCSQAQAAGFFHAFEGNQAPSAGKQVLQPINYRIQAADQPALKSFLFSLGSDPAKAEIISLPMPNGSARDFYVWNTPMMEEPLRSRFSDIQTFTARAVDNPAVTAKLDYTFWGFHAMVFDGTNTFFIDPYSNVADGYYTVYYKRDYRRPEQQYMVCGVGEATLPDAEGNLPETLDGQPPSLGLKQNGDTHKTYRLALSCTGEYAAAVGGTTPTTISVLSAMTTSMNRVNGIYEREVSVTMVMIGNNDQLVYLNASSDPFNSNNNGNALLGENQTNTNTVIGSANYDIGHIFSTGGGGVAFLGCVCRNFSKARGVTGSANPVGDPYDVDYVAHEMGHQFGANHTFNRCSGTENGFTAYEPGSGSTIMAYAGICGPINNLQPHSDDYFHTASLDEISDYITNDQGSTCAVTSAGIALPVLPPIAASYAIPYLTPFELMGPAATPGAAEDALSYCWEEWDLGNLTADENGSANFIAGPTFRSFRPVTGRLRVFPRIDSIVDNTTSYTGERLPAVARTLRFKLAARSLSNGLGAFDFSDDVVTLNVINTGQPFRVTSPNISTDTAYANSPKTITWNVAQTDVAPISAANVDIYLSIDGGYTYPFVLATGVPNNGSAAVTMPDTFSLWARVKVKGADNVFFDISDVNFKLIDTNRVMSIADVQLRNDLTIWPNPAVNEIRVTSKSNARLGLALFNAIGQKLWSGNLQKNAVIPVGSFTRGIYYLKVTDEQRGAQTVRSIALQ